jgi:hypothetical protein
MKALIALAHRPAGLTLRENVLNLGFAAREIAIGWFPQWSASRLGCGMNVLIFYIVRHDGSTLSWEEGDPPTTAPTAVAHYRERLMEYDPPVASTLIARCNSSTCCCISASVRSIFMLVQCRNEWMLAPVQSRTVFLDGAFNVST